MNLKQLLQITIAGVVATAIPLISAPKSVAQSAAPLSSFQCQISPDQLFVTLAVRQNGQVSDPMIVWKTEEFSGAGYTPERRCTEVTNRLNSLLQENNQSLEGLYMTAGLVNGEAVLCAVSSTRAGCNTRNVLFTLNHANRRNPSQMLRNLASAGVVGSGSAIQESGGQPYVDLQILVNQLF
ncbi:COP23 domain-containing protein [Laspinema sp. A4]|uniref:COP23 domain-containing protein n=1 Tax=Laspinema sp. D2d TaxID=2953686 RepID=UPI0021BB8750|nr:COP23 domain-containing protein [Laspinema sp. D2d]MCT7983557.1 COP23 domain-containing protein [Laspinema sp. D2d]